MSKLEVDIPLPFGAAKNHPKSIVVHAMGEYIDSHDRDYAAHEWLQKIGLSAHALVAPYGLVIRCRADDQGAYHARGHNTNTLGVEFLVRGCHTYSTFLEALKTHWVDGDQYHAGVELVRAWCDRWDIGPESICRHSDLSPGRKYDPGEGFPWDDFLHDVTA